MQPAQDLVQVDQTGGEPGQPPVAGIGLGRHLDSPAQGIGEIDEAGGRRAGFRQGVELLLGLFDLVASAGLNVAVGLGGNLPAQSDQLAAQGQVVDHPGIVGRVGRRRGPVDQVGKVAQPTQLLEAGIAAEAFDKHDRLGQLALADMLLHCGEQALVERLVEMRGLQGVADPLIGGVVEQDRPQQSLFGLEVGGQAVGGGGLDGAKVESGDEGSHWLRVA